MTISRNKLVEKASAAVSRGKYERALDAYQQLEKLEPKDGAWSRRAGEMLRHLGRTSDAVHSFGRAVEVYARAGFLVKAIAVCKLILRIEPDHRTATNKIEELSRARFASPARRELRSYSSPAASSTSAPAPSAPRRPAQRRPTIPPGLPLEEVVLRDTVPGAEASLGNTRITLIPIDTSDFDEAFIDITDGVGEALTATPLFDGLAAANLQALIENVTTRTVAADEVVFRQGESGRELFVIDEGKVAVLAEGEGGTPRVELGVLGEGEFFGEIALVAETPRSATVVALEPTELLVLSRDAISNLVDSEPRVLGLLLRFLKDRLLDRLSKTHPLLASFPETERAELTSRFQFLEVEKGTAVITEGERSLGIFVVLAGQIEVSRVGADPPVLATLGPGAVVGEMSLLTQEPAVATVKTLSKAFVVGLPAADFRQLIMTHPQVLAYVGELADQRQRLVESIEAGSTPESSFESLHVKLL